MPANILNLPGLRVLQSENQALMQLITERVAQPTPDEIRAARERARLNQTQAAGLVSPATAAGYKTWSGYEQPVGTRNHRAIPLAAWELFLLLTNQHPSMYLNKGAARVPGGHS